MLTVPIISGFCGRGGNFSDLKSEYSELLEVGAVVVDQAHNSFVLVAQVLRKQAGVGAALFLNCCAAECHSATSRLRRCSNW